MPARVQSKKAIERPLANHPHRGAQNLIPNKPGEPPRGGREPGKQNKISRMLKEVAIRGIEEAGDYLLRKEEVHEEEAYQKLKDNGATPEELEQFWRTARALRRKVGGAEGYFAWAAIEDPAATLQFLGKILPIQLREAGSGSIEHTQTNEDGSTTTTKTRLSATDIREQLAERGLVLPNLIDVTPVKPKNPNAEDPNPMVVQGGVSKRMEDE